MGATTSERNDTRQSNRGAIQHMLYLVPVSISFLVLMFASTWPGLNWNVAFLFATFPLLLSLLAFAVFVALNLTTGGPLSKKVLLIGPLLGIIVVTSLTLGLGVKARFALDRDEFQTQVDDLQLDGTAAATAPPTPEQIGTYRISEVRQTGEAVWFVNDGSFLGTEAGFLYAPGGLDTVDSTTGWGTIRYTSLGDGWYAFVAPY